MLYVGKSTCFWGGYFCLYLLMIFSVFISVSLAWNHGDTIHFSAGKMAGFQHLHCYKKRFPIIFNQFDFVISIYLYIYIHAHINSVFIYECMYVCMHACMHVCMYIYIYTYMYTYTDIYIITYVKNRHIHHNPICSQLPAWDMPHVLLPWLCRWFHAKASCAASVTYVFRS